MSEVGVALSAIGTWQLQCSEIYPEPESGLVAAGTRGDELLDEDASVRLDDVPRGQIGRFDREFDVGQAFGLCAREQQAQRLRRVTVPPLPRDDGVANVTEHMRWQFAGARRSWHL